jgi:4-hydroxy-tetrahydrodipicolinate synthase
MSPSLTPLARGVWGVVATPFADDSLKIDEASLARLAQHYEKIGATGLTALGVFGEAASLSTLERRLVLEVLSAAVSLPLVVGVTSLATAPAVEEIELARNVIGDQLAGAMVQVNSAQPSLLRRHIDSIFENTGIGIVVQDYPSASQVKISPDRLIAALAEMDSAIAVKEESSPTAATVANLVEAYPDIPVYGGLGGIGLLDELACGAAGAMTGFAFPEGLKACIDAYATGGYGAARDAFLPYLPLATFEQQPGIGLAVRKESLRRRGLIDSSVVRPPSPAMPSSLSDQLDFHLTAIAAVEGSRV